MYYDLNSTRPRWISLCRNCNSYNKKKSFRTGEHNLIIMASDKASNSDQEMISFFIWFYPTFIFGLWIIKNKKIYKYTNSRYM